MLRLIFECEQKLNMQGNVMDHFSILRGAFASLQELDLNGNNLTSLPTAMVRARPINNVKPPPTLCPFSSLQGYLANLRIFDASNNQIDALPAEIGALTKLEELRLAGNPLTQLPKTIGNCSRLEVLRVLLVQGSNWVNKAILFL